MEEKTRVIFRTFDDTKEVIAFLPDVPANPGYVMSYMHVGQHGEADYLGLVKRTHLSYPDEFAALKRELENIGYVLDTRIKIIPNRIRNY